MIEVTLEQEGEKQTFAKSHENSDSLPAASGTLDCVGGSWEGLDDIA